MGKKDKNKKKGLGIEKTATKTDKKLLLKQKKLLQKLGEVRIKNPPVNFKNPTQVFNNIFLDYFRMTLRRLWQHWNKIR